MENVKVNKAAALKILKQNRQQHHRIFLEAVEGYKAKALEILEQRLKEIKAGKLVSVRVELPLPEDQTKAYDRAIKMLEMSVDKVIELDETSFQYYIMDDWHWKQKFLSSNSAYSGTAMLAMSQAGSAE